MTLGEMIMYGCPTWEKFEVEQARNGWIAKAKGLKPVFAPTLIELADLIQATFPPGEK